jgi:hypothetical protein
MARGFEGVGLISMKTKWMAAALGVAVWGLGATAQAAVINRTFDLEVSRFEQVFGADPTLPPTPVTFNFTLMFDNSADVGVTTTGLTVNTFTLPYATEYSYTTATDSLALATTLLGPFSCSSSAGKFCAFIHDATSAAPNLIFFQNSLPTNNVWQASSLLLTYTDAPGGPGVPEPGIWALMLIGFGGLGAQLRRLRARSSLAV